MDKINKIKVTKKKGKRKEGLQEKIKKKYRIH